MKKSNNSVKHILAVSGGADSVYLLHRSIQGGLSDLFFWRSRAQSEVDLVVRTGDRLRAFEIKWNRKRSSGRAFQAKYGVEVEMLDAGNPFVGHIIDEVTHEKD